MPNNKFGYNDMMVRKTGGFNYDLSTDPNNDNFFSSPVKMTKNSDGSWSFSNYDSIRPNGGRDPNYNGQIGCDMDQGEAEQRGFGWKKATDLRDIEFKFAVKVTAGGSGLWDSDITIQGPTGRHTTPEPCCEGCAYGYSVSYGNNPMKFRASKEQAHSDYTFLEDFTDPDFNFQLKGAGKYVGFGFIRYNKTNDQNEVGVIWEFIGNPDPDAHPTDWRVLKHLEDFGGSWGKDDATKMCNARKKKQQFNWAMPRAFRIKLTDTKLKLQLKNLSVFEIDPTKASGGDSGGTGGGGGQTPSVTFGFSELQIRRDINNEGTSACVAGGTAILFDQENQNGDTDLNGTGFQAGIVCLSTASVIYNAKITSGHVFLKKHGTGASVNLRIRKGSDHSIARTLATIAASSISTSETDISFTDSGNPYRMKVNDYFSMESDGDTTNYISVMRDDASDYNGDNTKRFWAKPTYEIHSGDIKAILSGII